jgi:hypothetical protein
MGQAWTRDEWEEKVRETLRNDQTDENCLMLKRQIKTVLKDRSKEITELQALAVVLDALREFAYEEI